jgi:uncharacterized protein involved in response to NO
MKLNFSVFSAAPHRMFFFFGGLSMVMSMVWWLLDLTLIFHWPIQASQWLPKYIIPSNQLHGLLMIFGLFTFFILGFLSTTFPKWMNTYNIPKHMYVPSALLLFAGYLLLLFGSTSKILWLIGGVVFFMGWLRGIWGLLDVFLYTEFRIAHGWMCLIGNLMGALLFLVAFLMMELLGQIDSTSYLNPLRILHAALWWFLIPIFFAVSHRMIPFFTKGIVQEYEIYRPTWVLIVVSIFSFLHPFLNYFNLSLISDLVILLCSLRLSYKWKPPHFPNNLLLNSLHVAFFWLSIAMLLFIIQDSLNSLSFYTKNVQRWTGEAPLHALTIGFFTTMLIAMVTRVTQGHSGNPLIMSRLTGYLFFGIQAVAIIRVVLEIPALMTFRSDLILMAGLGWLIVSLLWFMQYGPKYLTPRIDGKPG